MSLSLLGINVAVFLMAAILITILARLAPALGLVDHPDALRKSHSHPTPTVGGLAIALALLITLAYHYMTSGGIGWLWLCVTCLVLMGLVDDRFELPYRVRFMGHLVVGFLMAALQGIVLVDLGDLLGTGPILLGVMAIPLTMFAVASAVNAMNLIDGMDGLASGVAVIPLAMMLGLALQHGLQAQVVLVTSLLAGVMAFMLFNHPLLRGSRRRCFLGDTGSNVLGFLVVCLMIDLSQRGVMYPIVALYLLGIPLMDTAAVIVRRRVMGLSPTDPGRDHIHHLLQRAGLNQTCAVLAIHCITLLFAALGLGMMIVGVAEPLIFAIYVVCLLSFLFFTRHPGRTSAIINRLVKALRLDILLVGEVAKVNFYPLKE